MTFINKWWRKLNIHQNNQIYPRYEVNQNMTPGWCSCWMSAGCENTSCLQSAIAARQIMHKTMVILLPSMLFNAGSKQVLYLEPVPKNRRYSAPPTIHWSTTKNHLGAQIILTNKLKQNSCFAAALAQKAGRNSCKRCEVVSHCCYCGASWGSRDVYGHLQWRNRVSVVAL